MPQEILVRLKKNSDDVTKYLITDSFKHYQQLPNAHHFSFELITDCGKVNIGDFFEIASEHKVISDGFVVDVKSKTHFNPYTTLDRSMLFVYEVTCKGPLAQ